MIIKSCTVPGCINYINLDTNNYNRNDIYINLDIVEPTQTDHVCRTEGQGEHKEKTCTQVLLYSIQLSKSQLILKVHDGKNSFKVTIRVNTVFK